MRTGGKRWSMHPKNMLTKVLKHITAGENAQAVVGFIESSDLVMPSHSL